MEKKDFLKKVVDLFVEATEERAREAGMSEEDIKIRTAKLKIMREQCDLEVELDKYTHNSYVGITAILNEHHKKVNELLKETATKCKQFLDDNNLPYEEEIDEDNEED